MAELTNQFCESTGSAEITLSQYGRYLGDAEKPPLPFLNERTVVSYFTGEPGELDRIAGKLLNGPVTSLTL